MSSIIVREGGASVLSTLEIDTFVPHAGSASSVTFTGSRPDGSTISDTVQLDSNPGMQTFDFGSDLAT